MNNKIEIEQLQSKIDLLKKQEQDELISKVSPKYVGKYFKCGMASCIHVTKVSHVTEGNPNINVRCNDISIKPSGLNINTDNEWCVNTEYLEEITASEFMRIALFETSKIIEQL